MRILSRLRSLLLLPALACCHLPHQLDPLLPDEGAVSGGHLDLNVDGHGARGISGSEWRAELRWNLDEMFFGADR